MKPTNSQGSPAIWIYPPRASNFNVKLEFKNNGFMTSSSPEYNDGWRIRVDPEAPFYKYSLRYGDPTSSAFLDYDGFRAGPFQKDQGWCINQEGLIDWQRVHLKEIGFTESEIDDVNYTYGRRLLERRYKKPLFAIYPQDTTIVDACVSLRVTPQPESIYRLWLYFVPVDAAPPGLKTPRVPKVVRARGTSAVELAYLTDREIPGADKKSDFLTSESGDDPHERRALERPVH